jgi:hypothetical protein
MDKNTANGGTMIDTVRTFKVFQQATTGKLHRRRSCSITSRTRYNHFERDLTVDELLAHKAVMKPGAAFCDKCWNDYAGRIGKTS